MAERGNLAEQVRIKVPAPKRGLRAIDRGFQKSLVSNPGPTSAHCNDLLVKVENLFGIEMPHALARRLSRWRSSSSRESISRRNSDEITSSFIWRRTKSIPL